MHLRPAGSGFHLPFNAHTALILPAGTNSGLQLKYISAPSVVLRYASMEPFAGRVGLLQLAGEEEMKRGVKTLAKIIAHS